MNVALNNITKNKVSLSRNKTPTGASIFLNSNIKGVLSLEKTIQIVFGQ